MTADRDALLQDMMAVGVIVDRAKAELVLETTLQALAPHLAAPDAAAIAAELPDGLGSMLRLREGARPQPPSVLSQQLATRGQVSLGIAVEHAQAACAAIYHCLGREQRQLLLRRLPPEWAELFVGAPRAPAVDTASGPRAGHGHTLATGKPGSRRPLAEAAPPGLAQANSVAAAQNPHGETKLSSAAPGAREPLATARPGSDDSIAEAKSERPAH